jgi:hypothetical protein
VFRNGHAALMTIDRMIFGSKRIPTESESLPATQDILRGALSN